MDDIWLYTVQEWGLRQADGYIEAIEAACETLKLNPQLGRTVEDILADGRRLVVEEHLVYYRLNEEVITIIRVLHGQMDKSQHL